MPCQNAARQQKRCGRIDQDTSSSTAKRMHVKAEQDNGQYIDGLGRQHADEISVGGCVTVGNFMEPCCKAMKGILRNAKKHK